jgi:glycosyltransferase involved in cell wall biosynthesis
MKLVAEFATPLRVWLVGPSLQQRGGIATYLQLLLTNAPDGVRVTHVTTHDEGSIGHRARVFVSGIGRLLVGLGRRRIDVVHVHISDGGSLLRKAFVVEVARLFRVRVVVHANGAEPDKPFRGDRLLRPLAVRSLRRADGFVAVSNHWRAWYIRHWNISSSRAFVLPNPGPRLPNRPPAQGGGDVVRFISLGRLGPRKGTLETISAFAGLPADVRSRATLVLAGDGDVDGARDLVESLGLGDQIQLPGWVGPSQRDELLASADVFVLPSRAEGLPLALLEALAWGVVPITSRSVGIDEVIVDGENGLIVDAGDIEALVAAMTIVVTDDALRGRLAAATRVTAADLAIDTHWGFLCAILRGEGVGPVRGVASDRRSTAGVGGHPSNPTTATR